MILVSFYTDFFGKKTQTTIFIPENKSSKQVFSLPENKSSNFSITIERLKCFSIEF